MCLMAMTGSSKMQKPDALAGIAWCRPPEKLTAVEHRPLSSSSAAVSDAPVVHSAASYMPA